MKQVGEKCAPFYLIVTSSTAWEPQLLSWALQSEAGCRSDAVGEDPEVDLLLMSCKGWGCLSPGGGLRRGCLGPHPMLSKPQGVDQQLSFCLWLRGSVPVCLVYRAHDGAAKWVLEKDISSVQPLSTKDGASVPAWDSSPWNSARLRDLSHDVPSCDNLGPGGPPSSFPLLL